jgi:tetratricopeptide (TPR) repeat protein
MPRQHASLEMTGFTRFHKLTAGILILLALFLAVLLGTARFPMPAENEPERPDLPGKPNALTENILYAAGLAYSAMGNFDAARLNFALIREINPSSPLGYSPVGRTFIEEGQLDQALYWMGEAQAADPRDFESGAWMVALYDCLEDYESAGYWSEWLGSRVTNQALPIAMQASHHYLTGDFEIALQYSNLALNFNLPDRWNSDAVFLRIKRDEALARGDPESGIRIFADRYPGLFRTPPEITAGNMVQATDLALLLKMAGQSTRAQSLLEAILAAYDQPGFANVAFPAGLAPVKAEALAILGDQPASLAELRRIIDLGWRFQWRWKTDLNPNFNGVRQSEGFRGMVAELEQDMTRQRHRVDNLAIRSEAPQAHDAQAE